MDIEGKIKKFVLSIQDLWKEDPLDGDDTEEISRRVLAELDLANGNITSREFEEMEWKRLKELSEETVNVHITRKEARILRNDLNRFNLG